MTKSISHTFTGYTKTALSAYGRPVISREREFFTDNLLVQIHLIIEMILVDRSCAMGV